MKKISENFLVQNISKLNVKSGIDLYPYIACIQIINMFYILLFYTKMDFFSFTQSSINQILQTNSFPQ